MSGATQTLPAPAQPQRASRWHPWAPRARRWLVLSIALQLCLAFTLGHSHDARVFMATGYLVGHGLNPYAVADLSAVFGRAAFDLHSTAGYPPPWPIILGLLSFVYAVVPSLIVYNGVIKLPIIAANVGLALLTAMILKERGVSEAETRRAYYCLLFNPALLFFGAAWGQIDAIVAVLALAALALLSAGRRSGSAVVLALAICLKPTALPLLLVALAYLLRRPIADVGRYAAVFAGTTVLLVAAPFLLPGWSPAPILAHWNAHLEMNGSLSLMTAARLFQDPLEIPREWWPLGLLWVPALALGTLALRRGERGFGLLVRQGLALVLIFFLTRTWLSEPNSVLLVPFAALLATDGTLDRRVATALWALPLAFAVFNAAPLQLLFVSVPEVMERALAAFARYHPFTLGARAALVVAWQIVGWWVVVHCLRRTEPAPWN